MGSKAITVYEHEKLCIGDREFNFAHFNALVKFNEAHGGKYFRIGFNKIVFGAYVGVIQVGTRTIEILPKVDAYTRDEELTKTKWQKALLAMLTKAGYVKINPTDRAFQHSTNRNLLEVYLFNFLTEVQQIVQRGFVKKYLKVNANAKVLKGRLLINKQLQHNLIHKERFFTQHEVYDTNHLLNGLIKKAVQIVICVTSNSYLRLEFSKLLLHFEGIDAWAGSHSQLDQLVLNRKSMHYRDALDLAKLIIKNFSPDQSAGQEHILAILFNMNTLFERFVFKCFKDMAEVFSAYSLKVSGQQKILFWKDKKIVPDIVCSFKMGEEEHKVIIDAKWKIIDPDDPSDEDLRQMYAYNLQFGATRALLMYPRTYQRNLGPALFQPLAHQLKLEHGCELYFANIFEDNVVSNRFAAKWIEQHLGIS
jgi:5-methylcytosine-specific restriction enzyme subunit McrC